MRALLVDDDGAARRTLRRLLGPIVTGEAARRDVLRALDDSPHDTILLRWRRGSSPDALDVFRSVQRSPHDLMFVLLDTERDDAHDDGEVAHALELGVDDVIRDPVTRSRECRARLRRVVRREHVGGTILQIGCLRIDVTNRHVWVDGSLVRLTRGEFRLLVYLARRPNVCVSKAHLYAAVFETRDHGRRSNALPACVSRLRRKLRGASAYIEAVPGVGYRFAMSAPQTFTVATERADQANRIPISG